MADGAWGEATELGTGGAGANQDGSLGKASATVDGARTPGDVLVVGQPAADSATSGPRIDSEFSRLTTVKDALDLAIAKPLRNRLIWEQFATPKVANLDHSGWDNVRLFFGADIPEDTTGPDNGPAPLLENLDVDSVTFSGRSCTLTAREYGRAVSRTRLANVKANINIDPAIVDRLSFDAARAVDKLAMNAFLNMAKNGVQYTNGVGAAGANDLSKPAHIDAKATFLSTTIMQVAISMLEQQNAMPFMSGNFILLVNPVGAQHLKNERDTGGFRYVTARNNGEAGNNIFRGTLGMIEGADVVVANTVPAGKAYLIAKDAIAKVFTTKEGYGAQPQSVVSPQNDKLRRFLSWGWLHYVGYAGYDTRSILEIEYKNAWRPAGAKGIGTDPTAATFVTNWGADFGPQPGGADGATGTPTFG